ncbi:MAG: response regulator transcription factor, partial [Candidatus Dormibacteria bacterium]
EKGDLPAAAAAFEEALALATQVSAPWFLVGARNGLGRLARAQGDPVRAEDELHKALALCVDHGFGGVAPEPLEALAGLAAAGEAYAEAARLFGAGQALREATANRRWSLDQAGYEADVAETRARLGDEAFERAWKEGSALSFEAAAAYASRARGERKRPSTGWASLTPTELEVVALAATGLTNAEIGARLFISPTTAKTHLAHIYAKLGVANRAALAMHATARGIGCAAPKG